MKNGLLRKYIREIIAEKLEGIHISNVLSQDFSPREQIHSLAQSDDEEIASHLVEPEVDMKDCYGPVPPTEDEPGVFPDLYTKDYHVIPHKPVYRP